MDYKQLNEILANLNQVMWARETLLIENEGEVTEVVESMDLDIAEFQELLKGDGLNLLGEWLKAKEDRKAALKAEKDYITRQMSAIDNTMDFIKETIVRVMDALQVEKTEKSTRGYCFTRTTSDKSEVDADVLDARYGERINYLLQEAEIPAYITIKLGASVKTARELGLANEDDKAIFVETIKPSVRFTKPSKSRK